MTHDRAVELLRGMQASIINGGRLRSVSSTLDESRLTAMDMAIDALRKQNGTEDAASSRLRGNHDR